jgi:hypothetical protein
MLRLRNVVIFSGSSAATDGMVQVWYCMQPGCILAEPGAALLQWQKKMRRPWQWQWQPHCSCYRIDANGLSRIPPPPPPPPLTRGHILKKRRVSSPAPVTIVSPEGLSARYLGKKGGDLEGVLSFFFFFFFFFFFGKIYRHIQYPHRVAG